MNGTAMIVPVTPKLAAELAGAARLIRMLDSTGRKGPTDQDHFVKTVDQLEALTVAVLAATSSTPLTAAKTPAARFSVYSGGPLNKHIIECVAYLRDTVSELLVVGGFDRWTGPYVHVAMGYLKQLEGMVRSAIVKAAEADLATLSGAGIDQLLQAAHGLARATAADAPVTMMDAVEVKATAATASRPRIERT